MGKHAILLLLHHKRHYTVFIRTIYKYKSNHRKLATRMKTHSIGSLWKTLAEPTTEIALGFMYMSHDLTHSTHHR